MKECRETRRASHQEAAAGLCGLRFGQGQAMPPAVNCLTCSTFYQGKPVKLGKLGEPPNKYCYRSKCHDEGIRRGRPLQSLHEILV